MWQWIKLPKAAALLAFFLPWMTVSCSNEKLAEATGLGLAFGHVTVFGQAAERGQHSDWNLWLAAAIVVIAIGLALTLIRGRGAAAAVAATSAGGLALILAGTHRYSREAILAQAQDHDGSGDFGRQAGEAALAMIRIDWQWGYWLAVLALAAAAAMSALTAMDRDRLPPP